MFVRALLSEAPIVLGLHCRSRDGESGVFFTEFYVVLPSFTVLYRVLMGFTEFCFGFELILPGFTMFYRVSPSSTGFY